MSLTVEDGTGVAGADSYAANAAILAYWVKRPHDPLAATVAAASSDDLDGAAREATSFMDGEWGPFYRGARRGYVQGLLWPRIDAKDDAGYPLPDLPGEVVAACCELTARAVTARLAPDIDGATRVKELTKKIGTIEKTIAYFDAGTDAPAVTYGIVARLLAPILNGSQHDAPNAGWTWA